MFAVRNHNGQLQALECYTEEVYEYSRVHYDLTDYTADHRNLFIVPTIQVWNEMVQAYQELSRRYSAEPISTNVDRRVTVNNTRYDESSENLPELMRSDMMQISEWTLVPLTLPE